LLRGPIAEFPKFRGQNERIHCCRNVAVAGGTAVFVFSIPIQQAEDLQRSRSNRGPRLSPTISSGKITVLQRQDWLKEVAGESIKGGRKPRTRGKRRGRSEGKTGEERPRTQRDETETKNQKRKNTANRERGEETEPGGILLDEKSEKDPATGEEKTQGKNREITENERNRGGGGEKFLSATKPSYIIVFVCLPASTEEQKIERETGNQGELTNEPHHQQNR